MFQHRTPSATGRLTEDQRIRLRDLETFRGNLSAEQRGELRAILRSSSDPGEAQRARRVLERQQTREDSVRKAAADAVTDLFDRRFGRER